MREQDILRLSPLQRHGKHEPPAQPSWPSLSLAYPHMLNERVAQQKRRNARSLKARSDRTPTMSAPRWKLTASRPNSGTKRWYAVAGGLDRGRCVKVPAAIESDPVPTTVGTPSQLQLSAVET